MYGCDSAAENTGPKRRTVIKSRETKTPCPEAHIYLPSFRPQTAADDCSVVSDSACSAQAEGARYDGPLQAVTTHNRCSRISRVPPPPSVAAVTQDAVRARGWHPGFRGYDADAERTHGRLGRHPTGTACDLCDVDRS